MNNRHVTYTAHNERITTTITERMDGTLCESVELETLPPVALELLPDPPKSDGWQQYKPSPATVRELVARGIRR
jgi:hypothetical protein